MNENLEVLVAGNDIELISSIENVLLDAGYKYLLKSVRTLHEFNCYLKKSTIDIVVFDYRADISIADAMALLQEFKVGAPVIVILEDDKNELGLEVVKLGADDYCIKGDTARLKSILFRKLRDYGQKNEQKSFETELIEENERLMVTLGSIGDGVIATDEKGCIIMMNKAAQELTGCSVCYSVGKPLLEVFAIINGVSYEPEPSPYERVLMERKTVGLRKNTVLVSKDGTLKYVSASTAPIKNSDGRIMGVVVVFRDITRIRKAEDKLQKLSQAVEQSPGTIVMVDTHGNIEYVNLRFTQVTGYSIDEAVGKNLFFMDSQNDIKGKYREVIEAISSGKEWRGEIRHRRKNGEIFWEFASFLPIMDSEGVIMNYLGASEDITERKQMSEKLLRAKEAAEAANRAKSEFLANMSHEIRTPLNGMIGMTNLTLQTKLTEDQEENLNIINSCAELLLRVINDILDYSKIEAGKMTLENVKFDILKLLEKTHKSHVLQAREKGLKLSYNVQTGIPRILAGDPARLQQVLNNLISNAIKFTDIGEVRITVAIIEITEDSIKLKFTVSDTGIGIDSDKIGMLFKSFSQVDSSITRKYGGTGLGLAISKQLVDMMDGEIWVESEKEKGSIFCFTASFMRKLKCNVEAEHTTKTEDKKNHRRLNILLAEDDKVNQLVVSGLLEKEQYSLTIADNGIEAIKLFEQNEFDLILMDIQMPEMDGIEATRKIRKMEEGTFRHIPIIAVTAYALQDDRKRFLEAGMDDYIPKPISFDDFYAAVDRALFHDEQPNDKMQKINEHATINRSQEIKDSLDLKTARSDLSFEDKVERLNLSILKGDSAAIDKNALSVREHAEKKGYSAVKSLVFRIQLLARKNQLKDVKKLFEELKQEAQKLQ